MRGLAPCQALGCLGYSRVLGAGVGWLGTAGLLVLLLPLLPRHLSTAWAVWPPQCSGGATEVGVAVWLSQGFRQTPFP